MNHVFIKVTSLKTLKNTLQIYQITRELTIILLKLWTFHWWWLKYKHVCGNCSTKPSPWFLSGTIHNNLMYLQTVHVVHLQHPSSKWWDSKQTYCMGIRMEDRSQDHFWRDHLKWSIWVGQIFTFMASGRCHYPEKLTFYTSEQLRIKSLAHWPSVSSLVDLGFKLATF